MADQPVQQIGALHSIAFSLQINSSANDEEKKLHVAITLVNRYPAWVQKEANFFSLFRIRFEYCSVYEVCPGDAHGAETENPACLDRDAPNEPSCSLG
jgi:hypothetical protein